MKCFYHPDADAVGLCKHCSRALCRACAGDAEGSLACPGRCEQQVAQIDKLIAGNIRLTNSPNKSLFMTPALFIAVGIGFLVYPIYEHDRVFTPFYLLGAFSILFAVVRLISIYRYLSLRKS